MAGTVKSGKNKGRFKPKDGSRFKGCEETQMNKGKSKESAQKICAFIARRKKGGQMEYCYNCGHPEDNHRKVMTILGYPKYVDCIRPVKHSNKALGYKWIDVCQCSEFIAKDKSTVMVNQ